MCDLVRINASQQTKSHSCCRSSGRKDIEGDTEVEACGELSRMPPLPYVRISQLPGQYKQVPGIVWGIIFIVLGAVRPSHAGNYWRMCLLFNMFLCCSVYCSVQNIQSTKVKPRRECRLCSVKSRSSSDYWRATPSFRYLRIIFVDIKRIYCLM